MLHNVNIKFVKVSKFFYFHFLYLCQIGKDGVKMISKISSIVPKYTAKVSNKCKSVYSTGLDKLSSVSKPAVNVKQKTEKAGNYLFNKIKSAIKSINKCFSEDGRSKRAGINPLTEKEREKFISDTGMYDPNSPDYIHANYSQSKKSK